MLSMWYVSAQTRFHMGPGPYFIPLGTFQLSTPLMGLTSCSKEIQDSLAGNVWFVVVALLYHMRLSHQNGANILILGDT